jgi:hypothetical protein
MENTFSVLLAADCSDYYNYNIPNNVFLACYLHSVLVVELAPPQYSVADFKRTHEIDSQSVS